MSWDNQNHNVGGMHQMVLQSLIESVAEKQEFNQQALERATRSTMFEQQIDVIHTETADFNEDMRRKTLLLKTIQAERNHSQMDNIKEEDEEQDEEMESQNTKLKRMITSKNGCICADHINNILDGKISKRNLAKISTSDLEQMAHQVKKFNRMSTIQHKNITGELVQENDSDGSFEFD